MAYTPNLSENQTTDFVSEWLLDNCLTFPIFETKEDCYQFIVERINPRTAKNLEFYKQSVLHMIQNDIIEQYPILNEQDISLFKMNIVELSEFFLSRIFDLLEEKSFSLRSSSLSKIDCLTSIGEIFMSTYPCAPFWKYSNEFDQLCEGVLVKVQQIENN